MDIGDKVKVRGDAGPNCIGTIIAFNGPKTYCKIQYVQPGWYEPWEKVWEVRVISTPLNSGLPMPRRKKKK